MQALCVLLLKNGTKQSVFHVQRRHMSPDIAMVALAGATGELLGWVDFWLPMARSELSNRSLNRFSLLCHNQNVHLEGMVFLCLSYGCYTETWCLHGKQG